MKVDVIKKTDVNKEKAKRISAYAGKLNEFRKNSRLTAYAEKISDKKQED